MKDVAGPQGPYNAVWDTETEKDGPAIVRVVGLDKSNNIGEKQINVKIENDDTAPTVEIVSPGDGDQVSGNSVLVKVNASDNKALQNVQIYPNFGGNGISGQALTEPPFEMSFDSTKVDDGMMPIVAIAVDKASHETKTQIKVKVLNNPWHQITFDTKPAENATVKGMATISITCMPNDQGVDYVEVEGKKIKGGNPFEYEWDTTGLANGNRGFTISAFDAKGMQMGAKSFEWDVENP